jgi:DNA (cytosine-5)-methyltransferase 1
MANGDNLKAIDLYSGVGGWSLGLRLAGIDVVSSYERWGAANETNFKNNHHQAQTVDIRRLALSDLPTGIDLIVGSPPCTQFSFANRGGGGDIADGLEDIKTFLAIVERLKPRAWAMENVPRAARIIEAELETGGVLSEFRDLPMSIHVVNMEDYGLPQRRRRCIAGNFDFSLLDSYRSLIRRRTLGDVIQAVASDPAIDPIYGQHVPRDDVHDHVFEDVLNEEEMRINRAAKLAHPVYNKMPFPDPLERSVRTITATCTRVSRESIVIADAAGGGHRRLSVRERAMLQGFPLGFQFYAPSYSQKIKMVGNAMPPLFAFYLGHALRETAADQLPAVSRAATDLRLGVPAPPDTPPDKVGSTYRKDRSFRFALPSLHLGSGVRFELRNRFLDGAVFWEVTYVFGTSKSIQTLQLDQKLLESLSTDLPENVARLIEPSLQALAQYITGADVQNMQAIWSHSGPGLTRPFMMLDELDRVGAEISTALTAHSDHARMAVETAIALQYGPTHDLAGVGKITRAATTTLAGLLVGALANRELSKHHMGQVSSPTRASN